MQPAMQPCSTSEMVARLAEQVRQIEATRRPVSTELVSSGWPALDRLLPERGVRRGWLIECLGTAASGTATLALALARQAAGRQGVVVAIDRRELFYPPAARRLGIDLQQLVVVRPQNDADHAWAIDQALGWPGVAAVWCVPGDMNKHTLDQHTLDKSTLDEHTLRRWQLAAESSGAVGLLVRPPAARHEPCWAQLRLLVEPLAAPAASAAGRRRRLQVELLRWRGGAEGGSAAIELPSARVESSPSVLSAEANHETRPVHLAAQLAAAKTRRRSRRA